MWNYFLYRQWWSACSTKSWWASACWSNSINWSCIACFDRSALNNLLTLINNYICPAPNNCPPSTYLLKKKFKHVTDECQKYTFCASCEHKIERKHCTKPYVLERKSSTHISSQYRLKSIWKSSIQVRIESCTLIFSHAICNWTKWGNAHTVFFINSIHTLQANGNT